MHKIRLMIVDDSILFRNWLVQNLGADSRFEVVGYAVNALDAKNKLPQIKPDIMTLDIEMPGMTGIDFLREVLPVHPVPIILVSSLNVRVFDALAAGAVDFVRKPDMNMEGGKEAFLNTLKSKLCAGAEAKVRLPSAIPTTARHITEGVTTPSAGMPPNSSVTTTSPVSTRLPANFGNIDVIAIMPPGFTAMYAERLNRICQLKVKEASHGDKVIPGQILLAPGGLQMRVIRMGSGYSVSCTEEAKVSGHKPSVDVLFDSVASTVKNRAIGIILTGMGADGAAGMLRMRKAGAYTIGQNRETCVVYGMPMEAYRAGGVCVQSALSSIPQVVMARLSKPS